MAWWLLGIGWRSGVALAQEVDSAEESAGAEDSADDQTEQELEALRLRLRTVERLLDELRAAESADASEATEIPLDLDTHVHGYATASADIYEGAPLGFSLGDLVFTYAANLDRRYSFYSELAFEPTETGVDVDIEVVEMGMQFTPAFGIMAGRTHAPYSYWSSVALHGPFRFTPVSNPEVIALEDDGGGWMPIHLVGVFARGSFSPGFWPLSYVIGVNNGRSPILGGIAQSGDWGWGKAITGRLWLESPSGLLIGLGAHHDNIDPGALADGPVIEDGEDLSASALDGTVREDIAGLNVVWLGARAEIATEAYLIQHQAQGEAAVNNYGGYFLVGYSLKQLTPYAVVDVVQATGKDPLYQRAGEVNAEQKTSLGLRYDVGLRLAAKLQGDLINEVEYEPGAAVGDAYQSYGMHLQLDAGF